MAPQPTFKDVLIAFRRRMDRFDGHGRPTPGHRSSADKELIDRWISEDRAPAIWRKVIRQRPAADPVNLIREVLRARRTAGATIARANLFERAWSEAFRNLQKRVKDLPASLGPEGVIDVLRQEAYNIADTCDVYLIEDDLSTPFELSRKDQHGSRKRRLFMQVLSESLRTHYGRYFDEEVAILCEVAFGDGAQIDREHAIAARRAAGRATRKRRRSGTFGCKKWPRTSLTN